MQAKMIRSLLLTAFILNLAMLAVVLVDYYVWDAAYMLALFIAWGVVILVSVMVGLFANSSGKVVERVIVREIVGAPTTVAATPVQPEPTKSDFPFTYNGYTLYGRNVTLKNGGTRMAYFFSKRTPKSGKMVAKPDGHHVGVNERTGLPFLKRGVGPDGQDLTPTIESAPRPQCGALTASGGQCRNPARESSKYCASHFGYQPTVIAKAEVNRQDTTPRYRKTPDTKPSARKRTTA